MYFVVTLALKMLIYALVNSAFSGFASLKLHLFIHSLRGLAKLLFSHPQLFIQFSTILPTSISCDLVLRGTNPYQHASSDG